MIELAATAVETGAEIASASEVGSSLGDFYEFNPDERVDVSNLSEISDETKSDNNLKEYNPDDRVECSDIKDNSCEENDEYNPDDRVKTDLCDNIEDVSSSVENELLDDSSFEKNQNNEFSENPHQEDIEGKTYYYDDNGNLYRVENDLLPNTEYEMNGYKYQTDDQGRIVSAEGELHLKDREGRLPIKDSIEDIGKGDQKEGDDRGHLIGDQFDGSNGLENMVPQDANINRNDFKNFENELAKSVKDGDEVNVKVEPVYDDESRRPSAIVVTYSINGEENIRIFPNDSEA